MQLNAFDSRDRRILSPLFRSSIRARIKQLMQDRREDRTFQIKSEMAIGCHGADYFADTKLIPEAAEYQCGADAYVVG